MHIRTVHNSAHSHPNHDRYITQGLTKATAGTRELQYMYSVHLENLLESTHCAYCAYIYCVLVVKNDGYLGLSTGQLDTDRQAGY